jgi:hypothetical protein
MLQNFSSIIAIAKFSEKNFSFEDYLLEYENVSPKGNITLRIISKIIECSLCSEY